DPNNDNQQSIRVRNNPEVGVWKMIVSSTADTAGKVQAFAYADHPGTLVDVGTAGDAVTFPDPMVIRATPQFAGLPVTGATVLGTVTRPDGTAVPVTLFDDGRAAHGDEIAGDGTYSALFSDYTAHGPYTLDVT